MLPPTLAPTSDPTAPAGARRWGALITACLAATLIVMDGSIVNVALPTLVRELGGASTSQMQWIVDAYILAFAACLLSAGSVADRYGRRRMLVLGLIVFAVTSAAAGFARTPGQLIVGRALMGLGAALIFPSTLAIITVAFPEPRLRRIGIGAWAGCSGLGVAIGPVVGGSLLAHLHWGAIFLINLPLVGATVVGAVVCVRESRDAHARPFDIRGNALAISGLVALVWGLIEGPELGWTSRRVLGCLAIAVVALVLFVRVEGRLSQPMLDLALFRQRRFAVACTAIAIAFFGLFGFVFMVTQYLQFVQGYTALEAGIRTLPFAFFILCGSALGGPILSRVPSRFVAGSGLVFMAVGFAWTTIDRADSSYFLLVGQMAPLGVGLGLVSASATEVIMSSLATEQFGLGSSINDTARELGGTFGVAVMGSLFNATYRGDIAASFAAVPLPPEAKEGLRASMGMAMTVIDEIHRIAGPGAARAATGPVQDAFMHGFRASAGLAAATALAGGVLVVTTLTSAREARLDSVARLLPESPRTS